MSLLGTAASGLGGLCMGLGASCLDAIGPLLLLGDGTGLSLAGNCAVGLSMGLFGSLLDSFLGATLQVSSGSRATRHLRFALRRKASLRPPPSIQATYYDEDRKIIVSSEKQGEPTGKARLRAFGICDKRAHGACTLPMKGSPE
eukprot:scaffold805_cov251-Pinguiococcus_pyrenoidosus.AAC.3